MRVGEQTLERNATTNLASIEEIKEEMAFFGQTLHCYDCVFGLFLSDENNCFNRRKNGVARRNQDLEICVANAENMGRKGSISDSEVTRPVV
jgi:hypothetical protein